MDLYDFSGKINKLYEVNDVPSGFYYWFNKILNLLLQMFEYKNLPESLPQREIEINLLLTGHAAIVALSDGTLFTPLSSIYGVDRYYQPTTMVFANPVVDSKSEYIINQDCTVIYNSSLKDSLWYLNVDDGLLSFIKRYARLLADTESTYSIYCENMRMTSVPVTDDMSVAQSIKAFFKGLAKGKREIVADSALIDGFKTVDINPKTTIKDGANDWLIARDKILEQMYRDLGIRMYNPKKAQVTGSELESNDQLLLIALDDMLKSRREGLEKTNEMFGTDIQVEINEKFDIKKVENNNGGYEDEKNNDQLIR